MKTEDKVKSILTNDPRLRGFYRRSIKIQNKQIHIMEMPTLEDRDLISSNLRRKSEVQKSLDNDALAIDLKEFCDALDRHRNNRHLTNACFFMKTNMVHLLIDLDKGAVIYFYLSKHNLA